MELLRQLGAVFGWVSGAIAFVTACLFGLGFIATIANQRMLGLTWSIISRDALWYPGLGSQVFVAWAMPAAVVLVGLVIIAEALRGIARKAAAAGRPLIARPADAIRRHSIWLLALLALFCLYRVNEVLGDTLRVTGLLFMADDQLCAPGAVSAMLAGQDLERRAALAGDIAVFSAVALGIFAYAMPQIIGGTVRPIPVLILSVSAIQAVAAIPFAHGTLVEPPSLRALDFPQGTLAEPSDNRFHLVAGPQNGVWVWEPAARTVHWISQENYRQLSIGRLNSIFQIACEGVSS